MMTKKRPLSVTLLAILCMLGGLFFLLGYLIIHLHLKVNTIESIALTQGFLIGGSIFCIGIGLFLGQNWARFLIVFFSILMVIQGLFRVLILNRAWEYELYLLGGNSPVSLDDVKLSIFSEFLPALIFCIAILFVMNKPSVKSFFKSKNEKNGVKSCNTTF